ncbi:MAG TPA: Flp family type IVb pilin [Acetobacteraceae bacterium]|nr:Flp family type IVb pilin [Acetobacteraceae bacterium]
MHALGQTRLERGKCCHVDLWETFMIEYLKTWLALKTDQRAVTALEYGLIAAVIVGTIAIGFGTLASDLSNKFSDIGTSITNGG